MSSAISDSGGGKSLVLGCSQLVTLDGPKRPRVGAELRELSLIQNGAMLICAGKIERVGTYDEILRVAAGAKVINAGGRVVTPGFVDAHTHPVFAGSRAAEIEMRVAGAAYQAIAAAGGA